MPMNHYEVYYTGAGGITQPDELDAAERPDVVPGAVHETFLKRADANQPPEGEPFCLYRTDRDLAFQKKPYGIFKFSNSYLPTGELRFHFASGLQGATSHLGLYLEDATGTLRLEKDGLHLQLDTLVTRQNAILQTLTQSQAGLLASVTLEFPACRDAQSPSVTYEQLNESTVQYTVRASLSDTKTFVYAGTLSFADAKIRLECCENRAILHLLEAAETVTLLTGICTDWTCENPSAEGFRQLNALADDVPGLLREHHHYWTDFFARSSITLPDPFLEKIYYINQYALDCCSGKDGVMKHHACGLNGLWAIRHPNLWGSMWYWDVNIQAAFAGVFSSNRPELGKVFSDGLLSYRKLAQRAAKEIHNLPGCASDYPYYFYYSCWSWCAQYLWFLYEYTLDEDYLRTDAYPLFLELCEFTLGIFVYDEANDYYTVYPDISPEQGPLAHNTTITVACTKYLLQFTLKAAEILKDTSPLLGRIRTLLDKLPPYSFSEPGKYGVHFKDSPDAPDNLWIRHPSMLMPVFPIGEYDLSGDEAMRRIISNTLDFLEENCEIGIFGCSWIAAAAARIGQGQRALRILYEMGIDHLLRSNGLTAEATDHFLNFCLIARQPLYYPCMMEFSGEMLAAVNEMLLQSQNDLIRIFPALPDGDPEYDRLLRNGYSISDYTAFYTPYEAWKEAAFDKLLAKGAFEVSAKLAEGKLQWVKVHSKKGGHLRLTSDYFSGPIRVCTEEEAVCFTCEQGIYELDTEAGKTYCFLPAAEELPAAEAPSLSDYDSGISWHHTYTNRKIALGGNSETLYQQKLDGFLRDWYYGNSRMANHTVYKFDFTESKQKEYEPTIPLQYLANQGGHMMRGMDFVRLGAQVFTPGAGYGFADPEGISLILRDGPDVLRCDFAEGDKDATFLIEAPRGQYELLLISGDAEEDSVTLACGDNSRKVGGSIVPKGTFQCELIPVIQEYDEPIRIHLSTAEGYRWKLNALLLNMIKGY